MILHRTVGFQLQQDAFLIGIHQFFRRILLREPESLIQLYRHRLIGKKLLFNFRFHLINRLLGDQITAGNRDPDVIPAFGGGNLLHLYLFK